MQLPASFILQTRPLLGQEAFDCLVEALQQEPPVSIRLNRRRALPASGLLQVPVPWCADGYYLADRPTFTFDPLFHAGCYYVQEASSMFVEQALRRYVDRPVVMLDLCAAPGGKSTHARSLLPEGSLLVANEVMRNRSQVLAENLTKWGYPDVVVTNNDPADFTGLDAFFDVILTDVPCSGEGMFRKDPVAIDEWSPENVDVCWQRQRRILTDIWPCLRPGGLLVYSTCTYNTKEDEENVRWMMQEFGAEPLPLNVPVEWGITGSLLAASDLPVYRFLPHRTRGEGFFLTVLRKPDAGNMAEPYTTSVSRKPVKKNGGKSPQPVSKETLSAARQWLFAPDSFDLQAEGALITAIPHEQADRVAVLRQSLRVIQAGVELAEVKGKDLIPSHALAMSQSLRCDCFPTEETTYEQAIAYLRKESIVLSAEAPRGYVLLTYRDVPLGFVKNIGNRANNLYPQEWRIRSGYLPERLLLY